MPPSLRHGVTTHTCGCLPKWPREVEPPNPASVYQLMAPRRSTRVRKDQTHCPLVSALPASPPPGVGMVAS